MIVSIIISTMLLGQGVADAWTWTLYEDAGAVVLANEIPDTTQLRATMECDPGSGAAVIRMYGFGTPGDFAQLRAGRATAQSEAEPGRDGSLGVGLRIDHPTFAAFAATGRLAVTSGTRSAAVTVSRADLAKLRRFGELCAG